MNIAFFSKLHPEATVLFSYAMLPSSSSKSHIWTPLSALIGIDSLLRKKSIVASLELILNLQYFNSEHKEFEMKGCTGKYLVLEQGELLDDIYIVSIVLRNIYFFSDQILWYVWPHFDSIFHIVVIIEIGFLCIQKEMAAPIAVGVI